MHFYEASSTIAASPDAIWTILTDADGYPSWDSGIDKVEGTVAPGEHITVHATVNPGRAFPLKVSEFEPGKSMTWTGGMPLGLFVGVRTFTLTPNDDGTTEFHVREEYHGPMVALIWGSIPDLAPSFAQFANGLKAKAEASA